MSIKEENIRSVILGYDDKALTYAELLIRNIKKLIADIQNGLDHNNFSDVHLAAHSLKSVFRQIEAEDAANIAEKIENASEIESEQHKCQMYFLQIHEDCEAIMRVLHSMLE